MPDVMDIRAEASALFQEAARAIETAATDELAGAQRLLPKLLAGAESPAVAAKFRQLGERIEELVEGFLLELGEGDLVDDVGSKGFCACAALAFAHEDAPEHDGSG